MGQHVLGGLLDDGVGVAGDRLPRHDDEVRPQRLRDVEEIRDRVEAALSAASFDAEVRTLAGHPGSQLLELAEREGYDRIVLGGGETSPLGKVELGSIAEFVLLNAKTTVTLVR